MVSNKEEQLTKRYVLLSTKLVRVYQKCDSNGRSVRLPPYPYADVSETGGHILDTWYVDQNEDKASKTCLRRRSFFIMITSGTNPHENNSYFRQQYRWSYDDWIVTATFKLVHYTCKPSTTRGPSVRLVLLHIMLPFSYSDI